MCFFADVTRSIIVPTPETNVNCSFVFVVVALCSVQVGTGKQKQPPNSRQIHSPTTVRLQEQAIVRHRGKRL